MNPITVFSVFFRSICTAIKARTIFGLLRNSRLLGRLVTYLLIFALIPAFFCIASATNIDMNSVPCRTEFYIFVFISVAIGQLIGLTMFTNRASPIYKQPGPFAGYTLSSVCVTAAFVIVFLVGGAYLSYLSASVDSAKFEAKHPGFTKPKPGNSVQRQASSHAKVSSPQSKAKQNI